MSYRVLATVCMNGDCPSILLDEDTGDVIARSADATDPTVERDVRYTRTEWEFLMRQIGRV